MSFVSEADVTAAQDQQRTSRAFISFLSTALGADQAVPGQDGNAVNYPYQYQSIGPTGVGVEGQPISSAQRSQVAGIPTIWILGALVVVGGIWAVNHGGK